MYSVEYVNCRVCASDMPKFLGVRGNREYAGAGDLPAGEEHMVTNVVRCRNCGFVYTNPLIIVNQKVYDNPQDYYASSSVEPQTLFDSNLDFIERYIQRGRLLDIGCGKGEFLSAARKRGWEVFGIEPSVNFAKYASAGCGIDVRSVPLEDAGYADNFFDAVTLNMVLEHVKNPGRLLVSIKRVLKPAGVLFIEVPNTDSLMLKTAALYFRLRGRLWSPLLSPLHYPFHCFGYNRPSLGYLLGMHSFAVKKLVVRGSSLRGFRSDTGGSTLEKFGRNFTAGLSGFLGKGDVLMAIARKETI